MGRIKITNTLGPAGEVVSYLNFSEVVPQDGGWYSCIFVNEVGSASHTAPLNIYGKLPSM
jgi:hypothetical protein